MERFWKMGFTRTGRVISRDETFPWDSTSEGLIPRKGFIPRNHPTSSYKLVFQNLSVVVYDSTSRVYVEAVGNVFKTYRERERDEG